MNDVPKFGYFRLKNEEALQFKGPDTSHCFGVPYQTFALGIGVKEEGSSDAQWVDDIYKANMLFLGALDEYTADAKQIAWRLFPEYSNNEEGLWTVRCRLAVWK